MLATTVLEAVTCADSFPANVKPATLRITTEPSLRGSETVYKAKEITTPDDTAFCGNDIALLTLEEQHPRERGDAGDAGGPVLDDGPE